MTKKEALNQLRLGPGDIDVSAEYNDAIEMAIQALELTETVTEFADRCRECGAIYGKLLKQENILDKIRSEIEDIAFDWQEIDGEHESLMVVNLNDVLQIIDKYKPESEVDYDQRRSN